MVSFLSNYRQYQHGGLNYGFVEFNDHRSAEQALQTLNGRKIYNMVIFLFISSYVFI
jgi:hypothetical protein